MCQYRLFLIVILFSMHGMLFAQNVSVFQSSDAIERLADRDTASYLAISPEIDNVTSFSKQETDTINQIDGLRKTEATNRWIKAAIVPTAMVLAGTITLIPERHCLLSKYSIHDNVLDLFSGYHTSMDNYLQYAPLGAVFALKGLGVKSRSSFINQVAITAKSELLMALIVTGMKKSFPTQRPSGEPYSMPSGHAAKAFVSAAILDMEYRDISPWISVGGYAMATTTAVLRVANNEHWISDVMMGAAIGIASTKIVYLTHQYRWGGKNNIVVLPTLFHKGAGLAVAMEL